MRSHAPVRSALRPFLAAVLGAAIGAAALPRIAAGQIGGSTDIITGRITAPDGRPIADARVEATSIETGVTRSRTTNENGQYTILFPDGGGQYRVTVRSPGHSPTTER